MIATKEVCILLFDINYIIFFFRKLKSFCWHTLYITFKQYKIKLKQTSIKVVSTYIFESKTAIHKNYKVQQFWNTSQNIIMGTKQYVKKMFDNKENP